jgi:NADH-quinone oxidoreductase subunit M
MTRHLLSFLVFLPLLSAVLVLFIPRQKTLLFKLITLLTTLLQGTAAIAIYLQFDKQLKGVNLTTEFQFVERLSWIDLNMGSFGKLSIQYFVGVDGLNVLMILLSALVLLIGAVSSWTIQTKAKGYFALYLLLSSSIMGCFVALDFFLFFLFFEFMLLPMYFLIGIWGGERREYASIKFFIYTLAGSVFILLVMIGLYTSVIDPSRTAVEAGLAPASTLATPQIIEQVQTQLVTGQLKAGQLVRTFDLLAMTDTANFIPGSFLHPQSGHIVGGLSLRFWAFLLVFLGFAIKLPAVPVHTWLPDAHVEAPTPISVVLAGILLKIGAYGLVRIAFSIFPDGAYEFAWLVGLLGMISIVYGALNALAAEDLKRMIAYSSVSHMGFVLIGLASLTSEGFSGAVYQLFSHGILSALLFLIVGVLYDRTHDKQISHYRGLASHMPVYTTLVVIAFFGSLGLPGFSGFIGELFTLMGAFSSETVPRWIVLASLTGLVLNAAYFLWTMQKMFFGRFWVTGGMTWQVQLTDLDVREKLMMITLAVLAVVFGLLPALLFEHMEASVSQLINWIRR